MSKKSTSSVAVTADVLSSFRPAKKFSYHDSASITSLDFDDSGQYLLSAGVDKTIQLYDCYKGTRYKEIQSQKYGAHLARFSHNDLNCLYASTPAADSPDADHSIRYLSLKTKTYLRYFRGHSDQVVSLEVNPVSEMFMSSSVDHTAKLWDLRTLSPTGNVEVGQKSLVAYDPHGIVFAIARPPVESDQGSVALYDLAHFERGPFICNPVKANAGEEWAKVEFSNNAKLILIVTDASHHYILDAVQGLTIARLVVDARAPNLRMRCQYSSSGSACFSPDGKHVMAGAPDGSLSVFDLSVLKRKDLMRDKHIQTLRPVSVLPCNQGMSKVVAFNPKLLNVASADNCVVLWATDLDD